jgi:hypothetical protein
VRLAATAPREVASPPAAVVVAEAAVEAAVAEATVEAAVAETTVEAAVAETAVAVAAAEGRADVVQADHLGHRCRRGSVGRGGGTEQHRAGHRACAHSAGCQATDRSK